MKREPMTRSRKKTQKLQVEKLKVVSTPIPPSADPDCPICDDACAVAADQIGPCLTELELMKLSRYENEIKANDFERQILIARRDEYLKQIDPNGLLAQFAASINDRYEKVIRARLAHESTLKGISDRLGFDLRNASYDDATGVVHPPPPPASEITPEEAAYMDNELPPIGAPYHDD